MRIAIASRIYDPEPSAASFMLRAIAARLAADGHDVTVYTTRPPRGMAVSDPPGVRVRRARVLRDRDGYVRGYLPYLSFDLPLAFRLLFARRPDVYLVEPPPTTGAVVRVVAALRRLPYLYDAADLWSDAAAMVTRSRLVLGLLRSVEVFAIGGAAHAFAISDQLVARLRELRIRSAATVIGFGVDTVAFHYVAPPKNSAGPLFLYAGTYSEWHGAGIFLEAFAQILTDHPDARLIFIGNGSDRQTLQERSAELGLTGVEFRQPVDAATLNPLFAEAVASLASVKPGEGYDYAFATKVYSSLAAGCPVVFVGAGPTAGFIREAAETEAAGVATEYDVGAVAAAMRRLVDVPESPSRRRSLAAWTALHHAISGQAAVVARIAAGIVRRAV